jgi:hypothetical protein
MQSVLDRALTKFCDADVKVLVNLFETAMYTNAALSRERGP